MSGKFSGKVVVNRACAGLQRSRRVAAAAASAGRLQLILREPVRKPSSCRLSQLTSLSGPTGRCNVFLAAAGGCSTNKGKI